MAQLKLHIGCGKRYIPGWIHVDQAAFPHVNHVQDIRDLNNFNDESVEIIYACQVIEYFDREEALQVLQEWQRVLRLGGILRLSVPNFAIIAQLYRNGLPLEHFLGTLYGKIDDGKGGHIYHRTTFDEASLRGLLTQAGFVDAELWRWQDVEHSHVDDFSQAYYPHMDKENGILFNLNMEARKPSR